MLPAGLIHEVARWLSSTDLDQLVGVNRLYRRVLCAESFWRDKYIRDFVDDKLLKGARPEPSYRKLYAVHDYLRQAHEREVKVEKELLHLVEKYLERNELVFEADIDDGEEIEVNYSRLVLPINLSRTEEETLYIPTVGNMKLLYRIDAQTDTMIYHVRYVENISSIIDSWIADMIPGMVTSFYDITELSLKFISAFLQDNRDDGLTLLPHDLVIPPELYLEGIMKELGE